MVKGIETFKEYFKDHTDKYVIIGGTAWDMIISQDGGADEVGSSSLLVEGLWYARWHFLHKYAGKAASIRVKAVL